MHRLPQVSRARLEDHTTRAFLPESAAEAARKRVGKVAGLMLEVRGAAHLCRLACIRLYACHRCRVPPVHMRCRTLTFQHAFALIHAADCDQLHLFVRARAAAAPRGVRSPVAALVSGLCLQALRRPVHRGALVDEHAGRGAAASRMRRPPIMSR